MCYNAHMSVHEILSSTYDRPNGQFDYVDEEGNVLAGWMEDEVHFQELSGEDELSMLEEQMLAEETGQNEIKDSRERARLDAEVERLVDQRGLSYAMARLAVYGQVNNMADIIEDQPASTRRTPPSAPGDSRSRGRRREPVSSSLASLEIDKAQSDAAKQLGRELTDREMMHIASDVVSRLGKS